MLGQSGLHFSSIRVWEYWPFYKRPVGQSDTVLPQGAIHHPRDGDSPVDLHQLMCHQLKILINTQTQKNSTTLDLEWIQFSSCNQ